jgi:hypothetical protein
MNELCNPLRPVRAGCAAGGKGANRLPSWDDARLASRPRGCEPEVSEIVAGIAKPKGDGELAVKRSPSGEGRAPFRAASAVAPAGGLASPAPSTGAIHRYETQTAPCGAMSRKMYQDGAPPVSRRAAVLSGHSQGLARCISSQVPYVPRRG